MNPDLELAQHLADAADAITMRHFRSDFIGNRRLEHSWATLRQRTALSMGITPRAVQEEI